MAAKAFRRATGTAIGAGALAGAGQLGIGYGLGILRLDGNLSVEGWRSGLAWVAFFAALSVVSGATFGVAQARRIGARRSVFLRVAASFAAAIGAAVTVPLVYRPAAAATLPEAGNPALVAMLAAGAGVLLGLIVAIAVLGSRALAMNLSIAAFWVWAAALGSTGWNLAKGGAWGAARLGQLPLHPLYRTAVLIGVPLLIGLLTAAIARRRAARPVAVALSGLGGPALIGGAYLIAGPAGRQTPAYRDALLGAGAALAMTVLIAVVRRRPRLAGSAVTAAAALRTASTEPASRALPGPVPVPAAVALPPVPASVRGTATAARASKGAANADTRVPATKSAGPTATSTQLASTQSAQAKSASTKTAASKSRSAKAPAASAAPPVTASPILPAATGLAAAAATTGGRSARPAGRTGRSSGKSSSKPQPATTTANASTAAKPPAVRADAAAVAKPGRGLPAQAVSPMTLALVKPAAPPGGSVTILGGSSPSASAKPVPVPKPAPAPAAKVEPMPLVKPAAKPTAAPAPVPALPSPATRPAPSGRKSRKARREETRAGHALAATGSGSSRPAGGYGPPSVGAKAGHTAPSPRGRAAREAELVDWIRALATQESNLTGD